MTEPRAAVVHIFRPRSEGPVQIAKAHPVRLNRHMPVEDVFRVIVLECLAQVSANAVGVRQVREPESLHQMRVALRRLRVALAMFKTYREPHIVELGKRAAAISEKLGPARDLDVFLAAMIDEPKSVDPHGEGFGLLTARAEKARNEAWDQAADCVAGPGFALFLDDVALAAESFHPDGKSRKLLGKTAPKVLDRALERAKKRARQAKGDPVAFHHLRIALKKLRYTSEFLAPLYDEKAVRRYLKQLKALQEQLGHLNDGVHLRTTLSHLREAGSRKANHDPALQFTLGAVEGWYSARTKSLMKKSRRRWKDFRGLTPFWC